MSIVQNGPRQPGFILILTFFILSSGIVLVTYLLTRVISDRQMISFVQERERNKQLVLGGIELIKSKLVYKNDAERKKMLEWFFTVLNKWTEIPLQESRDGVDGKLYFYISVEEGKINLNRFFNAAKNEFQISSKQTDGKVVALLTKSLRAALPGDFSLMDEIVKVLKKRKKILDDLSDLFVDPKDIMRESFPNVNLPYFPSLPSVMDGGDKKSEGKMPFALSDIFTVTSEEVNKINPLYFSYETLSALGFKSWPSSKEEREKIAKNLANKIQARMNWSKDWDILLAPLYGKKYSAIDKEIASLFDVVSGAKTLSVICYGKTGERSQGVCALLKRKLGENSRVFYVIKRWYWI